MSYTEYFAPSLRSVELDVQEALLQSSVIKINKVAGVTVAPWEDLVPDGKSPEPEADHAFDVTFE